jgi:nucleotide-binding universal stress UspA family protein
MSTRIIVATDGTEAASGALHVADALAKRHHANVEVVSVVEPLPMQGIFHAETIAIAQRELEEAGRMSMQRRVREILAGIGEDAARWPATVEIGSPAPTIVRLARETGATLIVLGLGRHAVTDRWFGSETALRVMRLSHVPVLAVPPQTDSLPQHAVAAVDFSAFSHDAAEAALQILAPGGTLHLAHVLWKPIGETAWIEGRDWPKVQRRQMEVRLEDLAHRLEHDFGVAVETHFLEGDAARETARLVESLGAGLVAAGSHGTGFFGRMLMGSVSTRLVRSAARMVLIAPPRTVPAELQAEAWETVTAVPAERLFSATPAVVD